MWVGPSNRCTSAQKHHGSIVQWPQNQQSMCSLVLVPRYSWVGAIKLNTYLCDVIGASQSVYNRQWLLCKLLTIEVLTSHEIDSVAIPSCQSRNSVSVLSTQILTNLTTKVLTSHEIDSVAIPSCRSRNSVSVLEYSELLRGKRLSSSEYRVARSLFGSIRSIGRFSSSPETE